MLLAGGLYALTGFRWLLLLIVLQHVVVAQQFLPFLRLDGYYVVSDLAGVPDLFGSIRPILFSPLPRRKARPTVLQLRSRVRLVATPWVMASVGPLTAALCARPFQRSPP